MSHDHGSAGARHSRRLMFALVLTGGFMVVEAVVGYLANSLVLLADAGHMLTDVAGLSFALIAIWFAQRPATVGKTYGYYRVEILAALFNGILLLGVSGYILYEAYGRFTDPPDVSSVPLLVVASMGLAVNIVAAAILMSGAKESLNVRGAFLEVAGDLLGSLGAIAAGVILLTTGWRYADPLFAAGVGLFILPRTFRLMREAVDVLLEGTPRGMEFDEVAEAMAAVPDVQSVHDLHIWSVTSGFVALSGHVDVPERADRQQVLVDLHRMLTERFNVDHVTLQMETGEIEHVLGQPCLPGSGNCFPTPSASAAQVRRARQRAE
ncbi:MAG: cation diffusion facilitator family transporter [Dehalococcoidia bacterium]|nr:cation diffusion facilitator family transporter [Dehalococcoidia bacterium]